MIQNIPNAEEHKFKLNRFEVIPGTHLAKALDPITTVSGFCYHHQNIIHPPPESAKDYNLIVNAHDVNDGTIHGMELNDPERIVFSVL